MRAEQINPWQCRTANWKAKGTQLVLDLNGHKPATDFELQLACYSLATGLLLTMSLHWQWRAHISKTSLFLAGCFSMKQVCMAYWLSLSLMQRRRSKQTDCQFMRVVWNPVLGKGVSLEFARAMDNHEHMTMVLANKGQQYSQ